jgi:glycosyltransferase involved in cell wall biosynthesis
MRILKIIPQAFYTPRGTPLSAYHRARELTAAGHQVDILAYGLGVPPPGLDARVYRARGPHFTRRLPAGPSAIKIWLDVLLLIRLMALLCRERYDAIYAHEEAALLARMAGAIFRIPYIYDMHSSLPLQITDWNFSRSPRVVALFRWIERTCVRKACAVVAISPAVARAACRAWPDARCVVLANHFELEEAPPASAVAAVRARHGIAPEDRLIVYTGSFVALQALDLLLEAVPRILESVPNARVLLVGGEPAEIAALHARVERLGVAGRVILEPARPQAEMPEYLAAADVLVSPRVQGINPPGKLLSYLAAGRPVVATDTLVHNQLLTPECAILTSPDAAAFAEGVVRALTDPALAARVVEGARKTLTPLCSKSQRAAAYEEILDAARNAAMRRRKRAGRLLPQHRP